MKALIAATLIVLAAITATAQDVNHDGFVSFLVPAISDQPITGLAGSQWITELWIHTEVTMLLRGCGYNLPQVCPPHFAGTTERAFPNEVVNAIGAVVYNVPVATAAAISLSSRIFEQSQHGQPVGVDIPVIREDHFFTKSTRFVGIPNRSDTRIGLRLYDPRGVPGANVRVELLDKSNLPIAETVVSLQYTKDSDFGEPGFAAIYDLAASFSQLSGTQQFDVRLTPLTAGTEYWGMVSVTDNATQQVLIITADANGATPQSNTFGPRRRAVSSKTP